MPTSQTIPYPDTYFPVLVQAVLAVVIAAALVAISFLLGKHVRSRVKESAYESGIAPTGTARERFSVKFYLVGIVFILFDIEAVFLYPWAVVYRELKLFGFFEMLLFVVLVLSGYFYILKKGALDWSRETTDEASPYDMPAGEVKKNAA
jgi:NADH-quinone oxidoreductase subunit A